MEHEFHIAEIRVRLMAAKDRLSRERMHIFEQFPLPSGAFDIAARESYGFAYIRAERLGVKAIHRRMKEVSWLPAQIDTSTDITADIRDRLASWVKNGGVKNEENKPDTVMSDSAVAPDAKNFGNDFIHALARCLINASPDGAEFQNLADRIALLFRDLAYLVSSIHCCNVFKELDIEYLSLSAPHDLGKIALDLTATLEALALMQGDDDVDDDAGISKFPANEPGGVPYLRLVPNSNEGAEAPV